MSLLSGVMREAGLMARDRAVLVWMIAVLCLSSLAVWSGHAEVRQQKATIERLLAADLQDRTEQLSKQADWGGAAYYSFHLAHDPPSDFAFAAMGQRDHAPWKHRVRMLALEGQIHERDAANPVLALVGRFDFAFLAAFVLPLVLIALLHDLQAGERLAGRHDLLVATAAQAGALWWSRALLRAGGVLLCTIVPLLAAGAVSGASVQVLLAACALVVASTLFWTLLCSWLASWRRSAPVILCALLGVWILLSVIVPAGGRMAIDQTVPLPSGADIIMTQREAVNDGWDLPKEATMQAFLEQHPEWAPFAAIEAPFEWKWYYAFQQVGDQTTRPVSGAYTAGRMERDRLAGILALLAPPALLERSLQRLAGSDLRAALEHEAQVRAFHAKLRDYYYPKLFRGEPFDPEALAQLPVFSPGEVEQ